MAVRLNLFVEVFMHQIYPTIHSIAHITYTGGGGGGTKASRTSGQRK